MEIKTNFAIGDKVWVIKDMKAAEIEISSIIADVNGISVRSKDDYRSYYQGYCFPTKEALIAYISDDGN